MTCFKTTRECHWQVNSLGMLFSLLPSFSLSVGVREDLMGWDVHEGDSLAHYARACTDVTFKFPFGTQELMGIAARGNYDLTQHSDGSGKSELW